MQLHKVDPLRVKTNFFINYTYLISHHNGDSVLVDPAWEKQKIAHAIETAGANLKGILITHHHHDHVDLAGYFSNLYNIPIIFSKQEHEFYRYTAKNTYIIEDFSPFSMGDITITPYLTPGHTKGSVCYQIGGSLFTGDTLFIEGCGMCSEHGGDPDEMYHSIQMLKQKIHKDTIIYPGHAYGEPPGKSFDYLMQYNVYCSFESPDIFRQYRMRKKQPAWFQFK